MFKGPWPSRPPWPALICSACSIYLLIISSFSFLPSSHLHRYVDPGHADGPLHCRGRGPVSDRFSEGKMRQVLLCLLSKFVEIPQWYGYIPRLKTNTDHQPVTRPLLVNMKGKVGQPPGTMSVGRRRLFSTTLASLFPHRETGVPASVVPLKSSQCLFMSCTPVF